MEFEFVGGNLALDYVGTVVERATTRRELLTDGAALGRWLVASGVVDAPPRDAAARLDHALAVREALHDLVVGLVGGDPPPSGPRRIINAAAASPPPAARLDGTGAVHRTGDVDAALAVVARDGLDLYALPDRTRVRWCDDATCTRPFVDRSRAGGRRWCGMAGCGDRAKAAAYRRRHRVT